MLTEAAANSALWGEKQIDQDGEARGWAIGSLRLWLAREDAELKIATEYASRPGHRGELKAEELPPGISWSRWALDRRLSKIRLLPVFPAVPLITKLRSSLRVGGGTRARVYLRIPVWVRIEAASENERVTLEEVPSVVLSNTWLGTYTAGESCYWLATSARRGITPDLFQPHLAISPVEIRNESGETLEIEKLCHRVMYLSLFIVGEQLWADEMTITFTGGRDPSQIEMSGEAPTQAGNARLLSPCRSLVEKRFAATTFRLPSLPGLGFIS